MEDLVQVFIGPRDHSTEEVAGSSDSMDLEHFRYSGKMLDDGVVLGLCNFEGDEGKYAKPDRCGVDVWAITRDNARVFEPTYPGLSGSSRNRSKASQFCNRRPWLMTEDLKQSAIDLVQLGHIDHSAE